MKTSQDPRHRRRQHLVQELFQRDFHNQPVSKEAKAIFDEKEALDAKIAELAPEFPVEKINRVDRAILRLAVYEMLYEKKEPNRVIIDEAIELAKEYGNQTSPGFVNGALGKMIT